MSEDIHEGQEHTALGDVAARTPGECHQNRPHAVHLHPPVAGSSTALDTP